ncbi:MAG: hybrid sensor histidine kinase/response regulator [Candidatus Omnitrophica bacterium]|nr:hybrid sensor histidine kinase/response regulator [Candidatus Omnitrophota bacterium]
MQSYYDYKKYAILYVDDEEMSLKYFLRNYGDMFRVFTANNAQLGFELMQAHADQIGMLITDQRMPGEKGVQLLEKARQLRPRIVRILVTAYSDIRAAIQAVNTGAIYKYINKPWDPDELESILRRGLEFFIVLRERDQLLREKMSVLHNLMITDRIISLGVLAAGLGHYVRNSLVAVRTFLDLAPSKLVQENINLDEMRNPYFWKEFYIQVQAQVERIIQLLNDMGAASNNVSFNFTEQVKLDAVLSQAFQQMSPQLAEKNITIDNQVPDNLPPMTVDRPKFSRLFEFLLKDETVSLPPGSRITFRIRSVPSVSEPDGAIQLEVQDNGPGLPQEALRSIFDPFYLRGNNPQEFGIYLMACYFIVYHHGGSIEVRSEAGKGVAFLFTLPLKPIPHRFKDTCDDFLAKVVLNDALWEKLLSGA